jgi:hypothetical protein
MEAWFNRRCPLLNGITHADGRVITIHVEWHPVRQDSGAGPRYRYCVEKTGTTSIQDILARGKLQWTNVHAICESRAHSTRDLRAYCGCDDWEGTGFVALSRADNDQFIWVAYFENSEPFVAVQLTSTSVDAVSEEGNVWTLPIERPEDVTVR